MNILITGIHGFVGSNLVNALKKDYQIYGLDIIDKPTEGIIKTFSWEDLEEKAETLPHFHAIIHLAGKAHDTKKQTDSKLYFEINTRLTERIFDFFLKKEIDKFFFFSSVKAAADIVEGDILTEEIVPKPVGPYGESKIKAEEYIQSKWENTNKKVYIFRPCMIHGPGNKGNLNLLYNVVEKGIPWPLGAYKNQRSFCSVDNLCFVMTEFLKQDIPTGIYNVGDDEALSTNDLIVLIYESLGRKSRIWKINKGFMNFIAKLGTILHLPLSKARLQKLTENYVVSNCKIKKTIGIEKMPVSSRKGILKTIKSFRGSKNQV